jgi:hypothetical protein
MTAAGVGSGWTVVALGVPGLKGEVPLSGYASDGVLCPRPVVSPDSSFSDWAFPLGYLAFPYAVVGQAAAREAG